MISLALVCSVLVAACLGQQYNNQHQQQRGGAPVHYVNIGPQLQGDYKFGYNTGGGNDGSFREETRNPDGSVSGAYGYVDANGKQKVIRYTAGKDGFKAEGEDIPKAPPAPQPQPQQYQPQQYQPQPQQSYQPQPSYQQYQPQQYQNNYVQPQPSQSYNQYQPQNNNGGAYNPFAYNHPAPGQQATPNLLSYNIGGGGQPNHYQG